MPIKNVVIVNDYNYIQGGASKVAIDTAKLLLETGRKVYFFCAVNKPEENIDGIHYISTYQKEALKEKNKIKGAFNGIYNFKAKKELKKLLKTLDPKETVVHIHGWTKALSSSVFDIAFQMKFKVVLTLHDYFTACPNGGYFNYRKNEICKLKPLSKKCITCNCDSRNYAFKFYRVIRQFVQNHIVRLNDKLEYVISISNLSEKILRSTLGKNAKVIRIYNPIVMEKNSEKIDLSKNGYYLYVGRISKEKGVDLFCQAISELGLKGIAVGDGDERKTLEKQYPSMEFTGWKNKEEVKQYMKGARALVFPSRWYETAGLTVVEAQSLGIPCIISKNSAASEFLYHGALFQDYEELKEVLKTLEKVQKSKSIFDDQEKYSHDCYRKNLLSLYDQMIGSHRKD